MTAELPPLPAFPSCSIGLQIEFRRLMTDYGRACQAPLLAEIERLKSTYDFQTDRLQAELNDAKDQLEAAEHERDELRAQLEAAQRDAGRLDWLDAQWVDGIHVEICATNTGRGADSLGRFATVYTRKSGGRGNPNVRMAIDAARAEKPKARSERCPHGVAIKNRCEKCD